MPYVMPEDLITRRLAGQFVPANFRVPYSSLAGVYVRDRYVLPTRTALAGQFVTDTWVTPPFRTGMPHAALGQLDIASWISENKLLAAAVTIGALFFLMPTRSRRARRAPALAAA